MLIREWQRGNWKYSLETKLGHRFHLLDFLGFTNDSQIMWLISPLCGVIKNTKIDSFLLSHCWHSNPEPCVLYVSAPWLEKILIEKKIFSRCEKFWSVSKDLKSCRVFAASKFMNVEISAEYKLPVGTLVAPMPSSAKKPCNLFHKKQKKRKRFFIFWLQERFSLPILFHFYVSNSPSRVWVEEWLLMDRKSLLMGTKHWVETVMQNR